MSFYDAWKERQAKRNMVLLCLMVVGIGSCVAWVANARRDSARVGLTETRDFKLFVLTEGNPKVREKLVKPPSGKPVAVTKDRDGDREWYVAEKPLAFLQRYPFMGKHDYSPTYAVIKGPDALAKTQRWLKENGYSGANFQLKWDNLNEYSTYPVQPTKGDSEIVINAYYEADGRLYQWTGSRVYDLSEGFTGNAKGQEANHKENVARLMEIAR